MSARAASTRSITLLGLERCGVDVEVHVGRGLIIFILVGLPDASLREAGGRVRLALQATECETLDAHIAVDPSLAELLKSGSDFDLVIAMAILGAAGAIHPQAFVNTILLAEFSLSGGLCPIRGILPAVAAAEQTGAKRIIVAVASAAEASLVTDTEALGLGHLADVVVRVRGRASKSRLPDLAPMRPQSSTTYRQTPDPANVHRQDTAVDAPEVAVAGGHHLFLIGEPGAGKTMFASRLPPILPLLEEAVALQTITIHSLASTLPQGSGLI